MAEMRLKSNMGGNQESNGQAVIAKKPLPNYCNS
jgi:hypothetical protein